MNLAQLWDKRARQRWEKKLTRSRHDGVIDGFDGRMLGYERPDPLLSEFNVKFYVRARMRRAQMVTNATIARSRGKADGWDMADREVRHAEDEDWIATQVANLDDLSAVETWLSRKAA